MTLSLEKCSFQTLPLTVWGLQGSYLTIVIKTTVVGTKPVFVLARPQWVNAAGEAAVGECHVACRRHTYLYELCDLFVLFLWNMRREDFTVRHTFNSKVWKSLFTHKLDRPFLWDMKDL